jgi:hypothetical protein
MSNTGQSNLHSQVGTGMRLALHHVSFRGVFRLQGARSCGNACLCAANASMMDQSSDTATDVKVFFFRVVRNMSPSL